MKNTNASRLAPIMTPQARSPIGYASLLLLLSACNGRVVGWPVPVSSPPTVSWTSPLDGEADVSRDVTVLAAFDEAMDPDTLDQGTFLLSDGSELISGSVSRRGDAAILFVPSGELDPDTEYTATITTDATDRAGYALAEDYTWRFTTGAEPDVLAPRVIVTEPEDGASDVSRSVEVYATFSEAMDPDTINEATFTLSGPGAAEVTGAVDYDPTTHSGLLVPDLDLEADTTYTATVTAGATDLAGNPMLADYTWTFTIPDLSAPRVVLTDPADGEEGLALDTELYATFSEEMDPETLTVSTVTVTGPGAAVVPGRVLYDALTQQVVFTPEDDLSADTTFIATITTGATDLAGNPLAEDHVWTFTTPDMEAPTVVDTDPEDGDVDVGIDAELYATFSEPMDPATIDASSFALTTAGGSPVAGTIRYDDLTQTGTFTPALDLPSETTYIATITTDATDLAGNPLEEPYVWTFTTPDIDAPTVILTDPEDEAEDLGTDTLVHAVFSEDMLPSTISELSFALEDPDGVAVEGEVSYDVDSQTATFSPDSDLDPETTYTATIAAGVADLSGNAMEEPYVWTFSTGDDLSIDLGSLDAFVVVAGAGLTNSNASGVTTLGGDVGLSPSATCLGDGLPCTSLNPQILGTLYAADPEGVAAQAMVDLSAAYAEAMSRPSDLVVSDISGMILPPGVYSSGSTMSIAVGESVVLDGEGDADAVWVFQIGSSITVNNSAQILLVNGARADNVYWAVFASSTIGTNVSFKGNVLAGASNTVGLASVIEGRLLCTTGAITLLSNTITLPTE